MIANQLQRVRVLVLSLTVGALLSLSVSGSAAANPAPLASNHKGWARVYSEPRATLDARYISGWSWTGTMWKPCGWHLGPGMFIPGCLQEGTQVYAWPYGGGWHWAWTRQHGWLAVRSTFLTY